MILPLCFFLKIYSRLDENQDLINFGKQLGLKNYSIDNTNFGLNPQTVTLNWGAIDPYIIDSIDYETFEYDRYISAIDLRSAETDSVVYSTFTRIFSDRNIENLIEDNNVRNIVVLKPFAILNYSKKYGKSIFEGGVYNMEIRLWDNKYKKDLIVYKGDSLYKKEPEEISDTSASVVTADSVKSISKKSVKTITDTLTKNYELGTIIALFPDSDYNKIVSQSSTGIYRMMMRNGLQVFSHRDIREISF
ncbi:MAG: hypothetical protein R3A12_01345 [Ignavibacteria bacterium]